MSNIANVVLTDSSVTDHTFVPRLAAPNRSEWLARADDDRAYLCPNLVATYRPAKGANSAERSEFRLGVPLFSEDASGVVISRGANRVIIQTIVSSESTAQETADLKAMARDLIDEALWSEYVDGNPAY